MRESSGYYAKLGILLVRAAGLMSVLYSAPMLVWSIAASVLRVGGEARAGDRGAAIITWLVYLVYGVLLLAFGRRLGRHVARDLDDPTRQPATDAGVVLLKRDMESE